MQSSSPARGRATQILRFMVVACLLSGFSSRGAIAAEQAAPASKEPTAVPVQRIKPLVLSPEERAKRQEWERDMSEVPLPKKGCFRGVYPTKEWQEVPVRPRTELSATAAARRPAIGRGQRTRRIGADAVGVHLPGDGLFRDRLRGDQREWARQKLVCVFPVLPADGDLLRPVLAVAGL
jgi:hypothetical protein